MKVFSPFAGIGGIDLGLEMLGWETVAFSEWDPKIAGQQYAEHVFQARFPEAVSCGNIQELTFARNRENIPGILWTDDIEEGLVRHTTFYKGPINIIAGGFPCVDISSAGKQAGITGERSGLWKDMHRSIAGLRPEGVLIENVAALAGRGLDVVLADLAAIGYDAEWDVISAAGVGAPHLRERIFIIAWPHGQGHHGEWPVPPVFDNWLEEPPVPRLVTDCDNRPARLRCLGNSVVPQVAAWVGALLEERINGTQSAHENTPDLARREESSSASLDHGATLGPETGAERACTSHRRESSEQRIVEPDRDGSKVAYATSQADLSGPENLRQMRSGVHGQSTQTEAAEMLRSRVRSGYAYRGSKEASRYTPDQWDVKYKRGENKGQSKHLGWMGDHCSAPDVQLVGAKLPRAGRMTAGDVIERERSCTQKHAKAVGLQHMAATLRPFDGMIPTPSAGNFNDGEDPQSWLDRRDELKKLGVNGNGAGMPLGVAAKLIPTATAKDADSSRSRTAVRNEPPIRESQMGETLTDYVDPTNSGRLLPTPRASDGEKNVRSQQGAEAEVARKGISGVDLDTATRLLPTPFASDWRSGEVSQATLDSNSRPLREQVKLLPTPRVYDAEHRGSGLTPAEAAGTTRPSLSSVVKEGEAPTGRLNPEWASWLMGFPPGWTEL